jgi:hypothetical protein
MQVVGRHPRTGNGVESIRILGVSPKQVIEKNGHSVDTHGEGANRREENQEIEGKKTRKSKGMNYDVSQAMASSHPNFDRLEEHVPFNRPRDHLSLKNLILPSHESRHLMPKSPPACTS